MPKLSGVALLTIPCAFFDVQGASAAAAAASAATKAGRKRSRELDHGEVGNEKGAKREGKRRRVDDDEQAQDGMSVFRSRQQTRVQEGEAASTSATAVRAVAAQTEVRHVWSSVCRCICLHVCAHLKHLISQQEAAAKLRKLHKIRLGPGQHAPAPLESFESLAVHHSLPKVRGQNWVQCVTAKPPPHAALESLLAWPAPCTTHEAHCSSSCLPLRTFLPPPFPQGLLKVLQAERFTEPTPIQRQAVPAMLASQEILAIAPTVRQP